MEVLNFRSDVIYVKVLSEDFKPLDKILFEEPYHELVSSDYAESVQGVSITISDAIDKLGDFFIPEVDLFYESEGVVSKIDSKRVGWIWCSNSKRLIITSTRSYVDLVVKITLK